jgi:hypothetical protein
MKKLRTLVAGILLAIALALHFTNHRDAAFWVASATVVIGLVFIWLDRKRDAAKNASV